MGGFVPATQQPQQPQQQRGFTPASSGGFVPAPTATPTAHRGPLQWGKYPVPPLPKPSAAGEKLFPIIDRIADAQGVPRSVMHAAASIESLWTDDPARAGNPDGAYGPAQIEASNVAAQRKVNPHFDPTNAQDAFTYMAQALSQAHKKYNDWGLAAAAYNAGSGAIDGWLKKSGDLKDLNTIANSYSPGTTNNPLAYALRVNQALTEEQAQLAHRKVATRNTNVAQQRTKDALAGIYHRAQADHADSARLAQYAMRVIMPGGEAGIELIQSPVMQGPLQALGAYGELLTAATPLAGALAGRNPDVPYMPTPSGPMTMAQYEHRYGAQARANVQAWEAGKHPNPDVAGAMHDVISAALRGPSSLATAEERYSIGSPGFMAAIGEGNVDPRMDVALRMALDMVAPNPAKYVGFLTKAMRTVPAVDAAFTAAVKVGDRIAFSKPIRYLQQTFNPYAVLRQAAKRTGNDPEVAQIFGRRMATASPIIQANAAKARDSIYKGLTAEQRTEVGRRSQTLIRGEDVQPKNLNVPEPAKGPSLDERAAVDRHLRLMTDDQILTRKILTPTREFDPWTFLNMTGANVWQKHELSEVEQEFYDEAAQMKGRGTGKGTLAAGGESKLRTDEGHVKYQFYDQAKADNALSPKFDFADQLYDQLVSRGKLVILEDAISGLRDKAGLGATLTYRTPEGAKGSFTHGLEVLGTGEKGYNTAQNVGARIDRYNATQKTLSQLGLTSEQGRALTRSNPDAISRVVRVTQQATELAAKGLQQPIKAADKLESGLAKRSGLAESALGQAQTEGEAARMAPKQKVPSEADAAARAEHINNARAAAMEAAKKAANVASGAAREAEAGSKMAADAQVGWRISQAIYGPKSPLAKKNALLLNKLFMAEVRTPEALRYAQALKANLAEESGKAFEQMQTAAEKAAGGIPPSAIKGAPSLPSMKPWFTYDTGAAQFIMRQGATPSEAGAISRVLTGLTNFYRMGVVYGPIRHPFINLPYKFLAAGGSPKNLLRAYAAGRDVEWEQRLESLSGLHDHVSQPIFGGSPSTIFDTPLKNVYKEAADKTEGGFGAKALAGAGTTANAAISRAWQAQGNFVFNWAEKRMMVSYFRQLVEEGGMDEKKAANEAADAFWDSANVNKSGPEWWLNKGLLFYPWLKSLIPITMRAMVTKPQILWMPYARAQDWNRANGDPRWSQEAEGTIYLGNHNGQDQYLSWPGPQKYLHDVLSVIAPADGSGGLQGRLQAVENLVTSEFAPAISYPTKLLQTAASKPTEPGPPNFEILWDKAAPPPVQLQQLTVQTLQQLPFGQSIANIVEQAQQAKAKNPVTLLSAASFNPYSRPSPQVEKQQRKLFAEYVSHVGKIESNIYQIRTTPGSQAYKDAAITAQRDHQMIRYLHMKMHSQLLDPSLPASDKKALVEQTKKVVDPIQKEMWALQKAAALLKTQQTPLQRLPQPTASPTASPAASPSPAGFTPAGTATPGFSPAP